MEEKLIKAPFTARQVELLNKFQTLEQCEPQRCFRESCTAILVAIQAGWVCPKCHNVMEFASRFMVDEEFHNSQDKIAASNDVHKGKA